MSDDSYDDGLVHGHSWSQTEAAAGSDRHPIADVSAARTPSTVMHDDCLYCD